MGTVHISVVNASATVTNDELRKVVNAWQTQLTRDFLPAWSINAVLDLVPSGGTIPAKRRILSVEDRFSVPEVLGYHDIFEGIPHGRLFVKNAEAFGIPFSEVGSHELVEMLVNPSLKWCAVNNGSLVILETADPVQGTDYNVDGFQVANFVFPSWFQSFWAEGETQFDQQNKVSNPFQVLPGGYINVFDSKFKRREIKTHNKKKKLLAAIGKHERIP